MLGLSLQRCWNVSPDLLTFWTASIYHPFLVCLQTLFWDDLPGDLVSTKGILVLNASWIYVDVLKKRKYSFSLQWYKQSWFRVGVIGLNQSSGPLLAWKWPVFLFVPPRLRGPTVRPTPRTWRLSSSTSRGIMRLLRSWLLGYQWAGNLTIFSQPSRI